MAAAVHVLVFEGFADWEPALALAELRRSGSVEVVSVGFDDWPVTSMGGLRVLPDRELADVAPADVRMFILPGGSLWEEERYPREELEALLRRLTLARVPIAAICAATMALARAGLLADRAHTSNLREYLPWHVPDYAGRSRYVEAPAVRDRGLITASGYAHVEFARAILDELDVLDAADRATWAEAFRSAFAGFRIDAVAAFGPGDVERLLGDAGIVRHRGKIEAAIANAKAAAALDRPLA